eukprot:scaffold1939_cov392-Prasinococcus_capsulatus_cf.AAC.6
MGDGKARRRLPDCLQLIHRGWLPNSGSPASQGALSLLFGLPVRLGIIEEERMLVEGSLLTVVGKATVDRDNGEVAISTQGDESMGFYLTQLTYEQLRKRLNLRAQRMWWVSLILGLAAGVAWSCFSYRRGYTRRAWERVVGLLRHGNEDVNLEGGQEIDGSDEEGETTQDVGEGELCCVCLQRPRNTVFADCGHRACCVTCAKKLTKPLTLQQRIQRTTDPSSVTVPLFACPLCRVPTSRDRVIRIYN